MATPVEPPLTRWQWPPGIVLRVYAYPDPRPATNVWRGWGRPMRRAIDFHIQRLETWEPEAQQYVTDRGISTVHATFPPDGGIDCTGVSWEGRKFEYSDIAGPFPFMRRNADLMYISGRFQWANQSESVPPPTTAAAPSRGDARAPASSTSSSRRGGHDVQGTVL